MGFWPEGGRCWLCLQSLVTEELNGAQKDLSACLQRTSQEPNPLQGPLVTHTPVGKEGLLEGSWLTNFLPLSCWPRSWKMALGNHQSRKISTPLGSGFWGQGRGLVMNPGQASQTGQRCQHKAMSQVTAALEHDSGCDLGIRKLQVGEGCSSCPLSLTGHATCPESFRK